MHGMVSFKNTVETREWGEIVSDELDSSWESWRTFFSPQMKGLGSNKNQKKKIIYLFGG